MIIFGIWGSDDVTIPLDRFFARLWCTDPLTRRFLDSWTIVGEISEFRMPAEPATRLERSSLHTSLGTA